MPVYGRYKLSPQLRYQNGDANGAYCQSYLETDGDGIVTWVTLPEHRWPKHWMGKYSNPVVALCWLCTVTQNPEGYGKMTALRGYLSAESMAGSGSC